jgi:lipopolysaccharide/colanic/teichoic acid biosynthesis glycosyltransferase
MFYRTIVKPALDRVVAAAGGMLLSPLMIVLGLLIRVRMGSPVIFHQTRIGLHEERFEFCKFRTMTDERDAAGNLLPDDQRMTAFGAFLRSSSLDELPQLWNVLRGEMSLVGPRPLLPQYLARYSPFQRRRHEVKPGITGLAQVRGRNLLSWEEKFEMDVWYVDHLSARLDASILAKTAMSVIRREGIRQQGHVTAAEFMGTKESDHSDASE